MLHFLLTNDVELTSIPLNRELPSLAEKIYKVALPQLLSLYSKHDIKTTFYFTVNFAELKPEALLLVKEAGHDIGCHGYSHGAERGLDEMSYKEQVEYFVFAKKAIENVVGHITAFRAPELRINKHTVRALETAGFKTDSSIASQRFDGPMSLGIKEKIKWLFAPRHPYRPSYRTPFKKGASSVLEIPISAIFLPYIGTLMRISPTLLKQIEKCLFWESRKTGKPIVFIFHPNECLNIQESIEGQKTGLKQKKKTYFFADIIRPKVKCRNLGREAIILLEQIIIRAKKYGFKFITVGEFFGTFREKAIK